MALTIRMKKISDTSKGRTNFRMVVIERTKARDGRFLEELGYYDPSKKPASLKIDKDRYDYWVSKGALPSDTAKSLYKNFNKQK